MTANPTAEAAARVLTYVDAWEAEGNGPSMYRGYGTRAETTDPAERLTVADLRALAAAAAPAVTGPGAPV